MELIRPSMNYQQSYIDYIAELGDEERYPFPMDFDHSDFAQMLARIADFADGVNLPPGYVPSSTWWLVDNDELIGVTNVRHYLNDAIAHCGGHIGLSIRPSYRRKNLGALLMKLSIQKLHTMGVDPIHIHCYKSNLASSRTIIACGGILDSEIDDEGVIVQRFLVNKAK
ncbi:GNAT family N-acetyltransferase [Alteromonas facilis]|uniref:GNAT family N-acetyltransferase n=1 Tax=Alteromonas facilis TaxID=2048004 RepID=UPI00196B8ED2|nr:GNAT family N-acetyltransferase [Alteromonas facilis]